MAEPKKRKSKAATRLRRRKNQEITLSGVSLCPQCKSPFTPHRACGVCGTYRGRQVVKAKTKK
ncbi:50S ribosomal protein L32 [Candidatus Microgenomates bacterium]|nr:50S ribosomal protein L32 [Candidatus Microgenomates bacterium]